MGRERGLFVTIDGPSGVGKTTVAALLRDRLQDRGKTVLLTATPSSSPIGDLARHGTFKFHGVELTFLVAADRYHHFRTTIRPALDAGTTVVCDRFVPSSLVLDQSDGVEWDFVLAVYGGLDVPDVAFVLRGVPELCARRATARGGYSRFHSPSVEDSLREGTMFRSATSFLLDTGYPAHEHDIGAASAEVVADDLMSAIVSLEESRS